VFVMYIWDPGFNPQHSKRKKNHHHKSHLSKYQPTNILKEWWPTSLFVVEKKYVSYQLNVQNQKNNQELKYCKPKGHSTEPRIKNLTELNWKNYHTWLGLVAHTCNPNTQKAEAGRSLVWGHPGVHSETTSQN
jgi:hypothetical protein